MKKYIYLTLLLLGCEATYEVPFSESFQSELPEVTTTIQAVWERVQQSESGFVRFDETESPLWFAGVVTSSDAAGNFYKELYLQDDAKQPTRALRFLLDQSALHSFTPPGTKVIVNLNGLGAGIYQGILSIGAYEADGVAPLADHLVKKHLIRTDTKENIEPLKIEISEITPKHFGMFVQFEGIQFSKSELGKTYAGEAFDAFDGERWLVQCRDFRSIILSTSTFSKFKSVVVDSLQGSITGHLTRDFFNEKTIVEVNTPSQINFSESRCDPYFEESFETHTLGRFEREGWINWIEKGTQYWEVFEDKNSLGQSLRIGSYRSRDKETVCWLVSPEFTLTSLNQAFFSFRSSTAFADKSSLEVLFSTDFNGNPTQIKKAKWTPFDLIIASLEDSETLWIDSGSVLLSEYKSLYIAFRYKGSGKTAEDGTYELDDIQIFEVD